MDSTHASPDPGHNPSAALLALRERLRAARAERGACPPWEELRDDLLPGGGQRAGRADRIAHLELCPYCDAHVREWKQSMDRTADTIEALEKGVARGVVSGAKKIAELATRPLAAPEPVAPAPPTPAPPPTPSAAPTPPPAAPATRAATPPPVAPAPPPPAPEPPAARPTYFVSVDTPRPAPRPMPKAPAAPVPAPPRSEDAPTAPLRLLVVECSQHAAVPESVFLCAAVMEAEVACVDRVEDLGGDPDLDAVCGVIFAGGRPSAEWPEAVRRAKDLAPGRPVVVLTPGGALPTGVRRSIGARLVGADDPAEHLLIALEG